MNVTLNYIPGVEESYHISGVEALLRECSLGDYKEIQKSIISLLLVFWRDQLPDNTKAVLSALISYKRALENGPSKVRAVATATMVQLSKSPSVRFDCLLESKEGQFSGNGIFEHQDRAVEWKNMVEVVKQVLRKTQIDLEILVEVYRTTSNPQDVVKLLSYISGHSVETIDTFHLVARAPLVEYSEGQNIGLHLARLEEVLNNKHELKFHHLSPRAIQEWFFLLLASSQDEDTTKSMTLLLHALPYCVNKLKGVATDSLKSSLSSTDDEEIISAIHDQIKVLIKTTESRSEENDWPTLNAVMKFAASDQIQEPIPILRLAILNWMAITKPGPIDVADVVKACAQFALGFTRVSESVQGITYNLLRSFTERHGFDLAPVLVQLLGADGSSYKWTDSLEGEELDLFVTIANRTITRKKHHLVAYCTRTEATAKSRALAIRLAPALTYDQACHVINCLQGEELELFLEAVRKETFPRDNRALIYESLRKKRLYLAVKLFAQYNLPLLKQVLTQFKELLHKKNGLEVTNEDKETVRVLFKAQWFNDTEIAIEVAKLTDLLTEIVNKCWLEDEITKEMIDEKVRGIKVQPRPVQTARSPGSPIALQIN